MTEAGKYSAAKHAKPRVFALLSLVALAFFQFASAAHDSQHLAGDITDQCAICLHLDKAEDAVADIAVGHETGIASYRSDCLQALPSIRTPAARHRARAPPLA